MCGGVQVDPLALQVVGQRLAEPDDAQRFSHFGESKMKTRNRHARATPGEATVWLTGILGRERRKIKPNASYHLA